MILALKVISSCEGAKALYPEVLRHKNINKVHNKEGINAQEQQEGGDV